MAEARKVYPMDTFSAYMKGNVAQGYNQNILDLLSFLTGKEMNDDFQIFAGALAKSWIYEQHPELVQARGHEMTKLGESVSITPLPSDVMDVVNTVFDRISGYKNTVAEQAARIAELENALADKTKKIAPLEAKIKEFEGQQAAGEQKIVASKTKVDEYLTKVDALLAKIEEVKKHGVVTVAGGGGAAAGGDAGAAGPESGEPAGDFGFGSDSFNKSNW